MKLGKALTTGCAQDAYEHEYEYDLDEAATLIEESVRACGAAEVTAEAVQPRVVDAAIR